jgi:hypothetical protein
MPSVVEAERTNVLLLGLPAEVIPAPAYIAFVEWATGLGAEDERRWFLPLALQRGLLALYEEIAKHAVELVGHHDESSTTALRSSELATDEGAADVDS